MAPVFESDPFWGMCSSIWKVVSTTGVTAFWYSALQLEISNQLSIKYSIKRKRSSQIWRVSWSSKAQSKRQETALEISFELFISNFIQILVCWNFRGVSYIVVLQRKWNRKLFLQEHSKAARNYEKIRNSRPAGTWLEEYSFSLNHFFRSYF